MREHSGTCRVLYVVYWGAAEPLGQSLVLPSVKALARRGVAITLVTFEKATDWSDKALMDRITAELDALGVVWRPLRYHKRPKWPATLYDVAQGTAVGARTVKRSGLRLVHARTFVGGLMGLAIARLSGARLVFHNEGFYPDEQVDAGVWRDGSLAHRAARWFEQRLYTGADGIIALSERGRAVVEARVAARASGERVVVVPSCVDLAAWPARARRGRLEGPPRLVYLGSVGSRYGFGLAARFAGSVAALAGGVRLRILSPVDPSVVDPVLTQADLARDTWTIARVAHSEVANELAGQDCGLSFYAPGRATLACSPTKVGEYWASGIPVATTPGIGDTEKVIRRERVGVIVDSDSDGSCRVAAAQLLELLADPGLAQRCRQAAESHYSLEAATERQLQLYRQLVSD